jgi:hypothetical protein
VVRRTPRVDRDQLSLPSFFFFLLCFRYPASSAPARPRHPWRSRAFGGGVQAADRENLNKKEVTSVAAKKKAGGKKKSSGGKKSSKKK